MLYVCNTVPFCRRIYGCTIWRRLESSYNNMASVMCSNSPVSNCNFPPMKDNFISWEAL